MNATLEALIGNGSLTAGDCSAPTADRIVVDGTPLGADMSGRTLNRAAAIESVVVAPPGLGRETRAGCGVAGVRQLEAPLVQEAALPARPTLRPGGEPQEVRARFIGDGL